MGYCTEDQLNNNCQIYLLFKKNFKLYDIEESLCLKLRS